MGIVFDMLYYNGEWFDDRIPTIENYVARYTIENYVARYTSSSDTHNDVSLAWYHYSLDSNRDLVSIIHRSNGPARISLYDNIMTCEWYQYGKRITGSTEPWQAQAIIKEGKLGPMLEAWDFGFGDPVSDISTTGPINVSSKEKRFSYKIPNSSYHEVSREHFIMFYESVFFKEYDGDPTEAQIEKWKKGLLRAYNDVKTHVLLQSQGLEKPNTY